MADVADELAAQLPRAACRGAAVTVAQRSAARRRDALNRRVRFRNVDASIVQGCDAQNVRVELVASVEPSVVFSSLAARCVPTLCDSCTVDIDADFVDGASASYRISDPMSTVCGSPLAQGNDNIVAVSFQLHDTANQPAGITHVVGSFRGVAYFGWRHHSPTSRERMTGALLVEHAVQTVTRHRADHVAEIAAAEIGHLQTALRNSRYIGAAVGILMNQSKITQDQAVEQLRLTSQHRNRKLRDLAFEVVETGWLDPSHAARPATHRSAHGPHHNAHESLSKRRDQSEQRRR